VPAIHICESGLRDGLQLVKTVLATEHKKALLDAVVAAGVRETDTTSFVPAHVIPQFADAAEVMAHARRHDGLVAGALVPNVKGAERALAAGAQLITFVISVSRSHNLANVRRTHEQQLENARGVRALIDAVPAASRPRYVVALSTAFGCSIEGRVPVADVVGMAEQVRAAGAEEIVLADTVGYGNPALIKQCVGAVRNAVGREVPLRLHLHNTFGTGLANALAGIETGITRFDAALGGLGGCPFAPGASGNIATEDLVFMCEEIGLSTGIDLARLIEATRLLARVLPGERIRSAVAEAGLPRFMRPAA
jgi:hydroxymethylglutaryl-CoA lyase